MVTLRLSSIQPTVCFIQSTSLRLGKSSRACAPRLSWRRSALCMVICALGIRLCSSSASIRSVFHTRLRSVTFRSSRRLATSSILTHPSASVSCVRNTAASSCMVRCIALRTMAVLCAPLAYRTASRCAMESSPASAAITLCGRPVFSVSATVLAHARPNTTMSSSELAPRRLAPCTEALAHSPAASSPGTTVSGLPSALMVTTSPL
mmetsp:Transcript_27816/g.68383  ORF Transcript_27816/g.68383 Transcript_27816/m.68383 type:complete len:207 (+) Transcript_27816:381-1001(+)